jgi:hypothetical protein
MIPPTSHPQRRFATDAIQLVTSRIMYARGLDTKSRARSSYVSSKLERERFV